MALTIRPATDEDEQAMVALWQVCNLVTSYNDPSLDFSFAKAGAYSDVLVGEDEIGRLKGSVMVGHDGHRGWLYYVVSDPDARRAGLSRQIVAAAEDFSVP